MALQTFTAGQVLTAAQVTALQANDYNQTVSTKTANYVLVAADKGTRVVMNSASATTITVNTSLFTAGDSLRIQNINSGATVITAGTATVTSAGSLSIPQWGGGQLYFTSASAAVYFPDAVTQSSGALVRVGGGSVGTSSAVTFSSVFNSTYDNYLIIASDLASASSNANLTFTISGISSGYYTNVGLISWGTGTVTGIAEGNNAANSGVFASASTTSGAGFNLFMNGPNLAKAKTWAGFAADPNGTYGRVGIAGKNSSTTQSTDFTLTCSAAFTAGRLDFYGYAKA
jgi:hypothetical protein